MCGRDSDRPQHFASYLRHDTEAGHRVIKSISIKCQTYDADDTNETCTYQGAERDDGKEGSSKVTCIVPPEHGG